MSLHKPRRSQPRLRNPRLPLPASVSRDIWREVDRAAARFNCSRSFVIATALADAMGVDLEQEQRYDTIEPKSSLKLVKQA